MNQDRKSKREATFESYDFLNKGLCFVLWGFRNSGRVRKQSWKTLNGQWVGDDVLSTWEQKWTFSLLIYCNMAVFLNLGNSKRREEPQVPELNSTHLRVTKFDKLGSTSSEFVRILLFWLWGTRRHPFWVLTAPRPFPSFAISWKAPCLFPGSENFGEEQ